MGSRPTRRRSSAHCEALAMSNVDIQRGLRASGARSISVHAILSTAAALIAGESRGHPLRALVAVLAIAAGVAMGYAVQLINGAALIELASTVNSLMGNAD